MKYLHIIPPSKRMMDTYIRMIRTYFNEDEHHFYFIRTCPESERVLFEYGNVSEMSGKNRYEKALNLYKTLKSADHIIWHSFIYYSKILLFLYLNPRFLKKSVWIMWGLDLHNWKLPNTSLHNAIENFLNLHCRRMMGRAVALIEQDKEYFYTQFSSKTPCDVIPLPISEYSFSLMDQYNKEKPRANGKVFIQIAHNAYDFNQHLEILDSLEKFKDEDLRLYLPLSYGTEREGTGEYIKSVKEKLEEVFPQKYYCLHKLMPTLEYTDFLWNMDIAIFNANRQNALGNLLRLLYMGNKVYLRSDGPLYSFFTNIGIEVFDSNKIKDMSYSEFIEKPNIIRAQQWIRETYHPEFNYKKWLGLFQNLDTCTLNDPPVRHDDPANTLFLDRQFIYKRNYLNVTPYFTKRRNYKNVKHLVVMGAKSFGRNMVQFINDINNKTLTWSLDGYLDDEIVSFKNDLGDMDVIGTISGWKFNEDQYAVCAIEDPYDRQRVVASVNPDVNYGSLLHPLVTISNFSQLGTGCIIGPASIIYEGTKIGDHSFIMGALVQNDAQIGAYCNIGYGAIIKHGAVIGKGSVIEDHVIIPENALIPENSHITLEEN